MQFDKPSKWLVFLAIITVIIACNSHKNISSNNEFETSTNIYTNDTNENSNGDNASSDEQTRLQIQELQHRNIIYFNLNKYDIRSEFIQILDDYADFLRNNPSYTITIEGHADERGTPEYNIALGERRANTVKMYLQGRGTSSDQITTVSYGKEKPAVLGHNEIAYSKNRRVVLLY